MVCGVEARKLRECLPWMSAKKLVSTFITGNLTFMPMHFVGLAGMPQSNYADEKCAARGVLQAAQNIEENFETPTKRFPRFRQFYRCLLS